MNIDLALKDPRVLKIREVKKALKDGSKTSPTTDPAITFIKLAGWITTSRDAPLNALPFDHDHQEAVRKWFGSVMHALTSSTHDFRISQIKTSNVSLLMDIITVCALLDAGVPLCPCRIDLKQTRQDGQPGRLLDLEQVTEQNGSFRVGDQEGNNLAVPNGVYAFVVPLSYLWKRRVKSSAFALQSGTVAQPSHGEGHSAIATKDRVLAGVGKKVEKPVLLAGNVLFFNGWVNKWDNDSGHYMPAELTDGSDRSNLTLTLLKELQFPFPLDKFVSRHEKKMFT